MSSPGSGLHPDGSGHHPPGNMRETASREFFENFARLRGAMQDPDSTGPSGAPYGGPGGGEPMSLHSSPSQQHHDGTDAHVPGSMLPGSMHGSQKTLSNSQLGHSAQDLQPQQAPRSTGHMGIPRQARHPTPTTTSASAAIPQQATGGKMPMGVVPNSRGMEGTSGSMSSVQPPYLHQHGLHPPTRGQVKTGGSRLVEQSGGPAKEGREGRKGRHRRGDGNTLAIKLHSTKEDFDELAEVVVELDNADQVVEKMLETLAMKFPPESVMTISKGGRVDSDDEEDESVYSSQGVGEDAGMAGVGIDARSGAPGQEKVISSRVVQSTSMLPDADTEPRVRYVEVPVYEEVIRRVPKKEYVEIEKRVPKYEVEWVEKFVEVPELRIVDKHVEVEKIEEIVKHVPRKEIVDVQKEVIKHVPKIITELREKIVEIPGEVIEVPKPYQAENRVPRPVFRDSEAATVVAQTLTPVLREDARVKQVEMTTYEPRMVPVDVFVPVPVKLEIEAVGKSGEMHSPVDVPAAQFNSISKKMNAHLNDELQLLMKINDWNIPELPAGERCEIVRPQSDDWKKLIRMNKIHCTEGTPTTETDILGSRGAFPPQGFDAGSSSVTPHGYTPPPQASYYQPPTPTPPQRQQAHRSYVPPPASGTGHRGYDAQETPSVLTSEPHAPPPVMPHQRIPQPHQPQPQRVPPPNTAMMVAHPAARQALPQPQLPQGYGMPMPHAMQPMQAPMAIPQQAMHARPPMPQQGPQAFYPPPPPPMHPAAFGHPGAFGQPQAFPAYGVPRSMHDSLGSIPMHAQMMPPWMDPYAVYGLQGRGGSAGSLSGSTRSRSTPRGGACAPKKKPKRYSSQDMKKRVQGGPRRPRNVPLFP